jgi:hypothetical protein
MDITFAHYRNRFCMFRTYYALAVGEVKPDGVNVKVIELADPPSKEQEEALIRGDVQAANLYLPNFLRRKLQGAPIIGLATEWKSTMKWCFRARRRSRQNAEGSRGAGNRDPSGVARDPSVFAAARLRRR